MVRAATLRIHSNKASWYAACYAMLLKSEGLEREEVYRRVLERFGMFREVRDQIQKRPICNS